MKNKNCITFHGMFDGTPFEKTITIPTSDIESIPSQLVFWAAEIINDLRSHGFPGKCTDLFVN